MPPYDSSFFNGYCVLTGLFTALLFFAFSSYAMKPTVRGVAGNPRGNDSYRVGIQQRTITRKNPLSLGVPLDERLASFSDPYTFLNHVVALLSNLKEEVERDPDDDVNEVFKQKNDKNSVATNPATTAQQLHEIVDLMKLE